MALQINTLKQLSFPNKTSVLVPSPDLISNGETYMLRWSWRVIRGLQKVLLSADEIKQLKEHDDGGGILKPAHCMGLTALLECRNEKHHSDFAKSLNRNEKAESLFGDAVSRKKVTMPRSEARKFKEVLETMTMCPRGDSELKVLRPVTTSDCLCTELSVPTVMLVIEMIKRGGFDFEAGRQKRDSYLPKGIIHKGPNRFLATLPNGKRKTYMGPGHGGQCQGWDPRRNE